MVVMAWSVAAETGIVQLRTARPSISTVQAPQEPTPHPYLVPVRLSTSRSAQSRGMSPSTSSVRTCGLRST